MVTWSQLGSGTALLIGLGMAAFGGLMLLAGGMSDAPEEGNATASSGCALIVAGLVAVVLAGLGFVFGR